MAFIRANSGFAQVPWGVIEDAERIWRGRPTVSAEMLAAMALDLYHRRHNQA
jgi:hypothetical protein